MSDRVLIYRPEMTAVWGGVQANLFVEQVKHWWFAMGKKPFYKFNAPCKHPQYKPGDSWQEELSFKRSEFERARDLVARRIEKGEDKDYFSLTYVIIYWRDQQNRLWYQFNEDVYNQKYAEAYETPDQGEVPEPESEPVEVSECQHSAFGNANIRHSYIYRYYPENINNNKKEGTLPSSEDTDQFGIPYTKKQSPFSKPSDHKGDRRATFAYWQDNGFGVLPPDISDEIKGLEKQYGEDTVLEAMKKANMRGVRHLAFVIGILEGRGEKQTGKKPRMPDSPPTGNDPDAIKSYYRSGKYADEIES